MWFLAARGRGVRGTSRVIAPYKEGRVGDFSGFLPDFGGFPDLEGAFPDPEKYFQNLYIAVMALDLQ